MNSYTAIAVCLLTGLLIPLQGAVNSRFAGIVGNTYFVGGISALVAAVLMLVMFLVTTPNFSFQTRLSSLPLYLWMGGLFAFAYLVATIIVIPKIGVGTAMIFLISGQLLAALLMDQFGILVTKKPMEVSQWVGVLLIVFGTALFRAKA